MSYSDWFFIGLFALIYLITLYYAIITGEWGTLIKLTVISSIVYFAARSIDKKK